MIAIIRWASRAPVRPAGSDRPRSGPARRRRAVGHHRQHRTQRRGEWVRSPGGAGDQHRQPRPVQFGQCLGQHRVPDRAHPSSARPVRWRPRPRPRRQRTAGRTPAPAELRRRAAPDRCAARVPRSPSRGCAVGGRARRRVWLAIRVPIGRMGGGPDRPASVDRQPAGGRLVHASLRHSQPVAGRPGDGAAQLLPVGQHAAPGQRAGRGQRADLRVVRIRAPGCRDALVPSRRSGRAGPARRAPPWRP